MPACPRRRSRARRRERYLQTASGVRRPRLFTFAVALDAGQQGLPLPFVGLAHPRAVVLCRRPTSRERSTKLICRAFLPVAVAGRTLHRPETDHLSGHQTPLPRFAPYDTSWGSSNAGSKQSAPTFAEETGRNAAASRPVLDPMRRRQHLRSVVVVLVLLALVVRIVLLARIVGDDLRGGQSGRRTIRQIRLAHTRLDQDSKA